MNYRPEIDGLRAVAVIPVILCHAGFSLFSGGFTGVDIFFVISGYLITAIILKEFEEKEYSTIRFYERRARRILPLLIFVMFVTIPFAWYGIFNIDMIDYFKSIMAASTFSSNFLFMNESGYFQPSVDMKPLLHTWSLAVEEQFYIVFPLLIQFLWRFFKKHLILIIIILGTLISFALCEWASDLYPKRTFYFILTRAWELGIGAVIALVIPKSTSFFTIVRQNKIADELLAGLGFLLILIGVFLIDSDTPFPSWYTLFPTIGAAVIICFAHPKNWVGAFLSSKIPVTIGLISYSAYMWHHPIFAFVKHFSLSEQTILERILLCVSIIPFSYVSWKIVENPFRDKKIMSRAFIFIFSFFGLLSLYLFGSWGISNKGFPDRSINKKLEVRNYQPDNRFLMDKSWEIVRKNKPKSDTISWFSDGNKLKKLLIVGNSHATDLYNVLFNSKTTSELFELGRIDGQIVSFSEPQNKLYSLPSYKHADILVICSRYGPYDIPVIEQLAKIFLNDEKQVVLVKQIHTFHVIDAKTRADLIIQSKIRKGVDLNDPAKIEETVKEINQFYYDEYVTDKKVLESDKIIDAIKLKYPQVTILNRMDYICDEKNETCFAINNQLEKYFYDYGHHTLEGASFYGTRVDEINWFAPVIKNLH